MNHICVVLYCGVVWCGVLCCVVYSVRTSQKRESTASVPTGPDCDPYGVFLKVIMYRKKMINVVLYKPKFG